MATNLGTSIIPTLIAAGLASAQRFHSGARKKKHRLTLVLYFLAWLWFYSSSLPPCQEQVPRPLLPLDQPSLHRVQLLVMAANPATRAVKTPAPTSSAKT